MANSQSADDALEEERQDKNLADAINPAPQLPQDNATPATPADDNQIIPPDHPITDSNLNEDELYEKGVGGAASVEDVDENVIPRKDKEADEYKF